VGFLTISNHYVWRTQLAKKADGVTYEDPYDCSLVGDCKLTWSPVSQDFILEQTTPGANNNNSVINVTAARNVDNLYGVVLSGANSVAVTADGGATKWALAAPLPSGIGGASSIDFPMTSTVAPGLEFIVASTARS